VSEMADVLKRICAVKRLEIARLYSSGRRELAGRARQQPPPRGFKAALTATDRVALIGEIKRASPSAGLIRQDFRPAELARQHEQGGARCLSVLTDATFFQGALEHLAEARGATSLPVMRKDFILDELQVLEARAWGADCLLLIAAVLERKELADLLARVRRTGMDALVEVHSARELEAALEAGADLVGINNRDLHTFRVDLNTTAILAPAVPETVTLVAESGIQSRADVEKLKAWGVDAVLVGEWLMRAPDLVAAARELSDV